MTFVDDADRHQHHAGAQVKPPVQHEIDIRLLYRHLAAFFGALNERVLDFERTMIRAGFTFPAVGSRLLIARKPPGVYENPV